jgi:hypothetical protein
MIGGYVFGSTAFIAAAAFVARRPNYAPCYPLPDVAANRCLEDHAISQRPAIAAAGLGLVGALIGTYFYREPHSIDENTAKQLADTYNQQLRGKLGLPVSARRRAIRGLAFAPWIGVRYAGFVMGARFDGE